MKTFRTIALALGGALTGLALLGLIGIVISAVMGVNADQLGNREAAGWAKLTCVICMGASGLFLAPGMVLLGTGLVCHMVLRRRGPR